MEYKQVTRRRLKCENVPVLLLKPFSTLINLELPFDYEKFLQILKLVSQDLIDVEDLNFDIIEKTLKQCVERTVAFGLPQDLFYKQIAKYSSQTDDCQSSHLLEKWKKRRKCIYGGSFLESNIHPLPVIKTKFTEPLKAATTFNLIRNLKKHCLPVRTLNDEKVMRFVEGMEALVFEPGTPLVKPLQWQDTFYYIESGALGRFDLHTNNPNEPDQIYQEGDCFGEENLFFSNLSSFTLRCITECVLRVMDRVTFRRIAMKNVPERHIMLDIIVAQFPGFTRDQVYRIVNSLESIKLGQGSDLLTSCPGCSLYILEDGTLLATVFDKKHYKYERLIGKGEVIGINKLFSTDNMKYVKAMIESDTATISFMRRDALERMFDLQLLYSLIRKKENPADKIWW